MCKINRILSHRDPLLVEDQNAHHKFHKSGLFFCLVISRPDLLSSFAVGRYSGGFWSYFDSTIN
jgi:hypothetical protein